MCSIYIIVQPSAEKELFYKIGIADDVEQRFVQIDCQASPLEIVAEYKVDSRELAFKIEKNIHKVLEHKNIRGEWFRLSKEQIRSVDSMLVDIYEAEVHYDAKEYLNLDVKGWREYLATSAHTVTINADDIKGYVIRAGEQQKRNL